MSSLHISLQPTLRQLLKAEALSEAQVISGELLLDREVSQVVSQIGDGQRVGTLVVVRAEAMDGQDASSFKDLAGLVLVTPPSATPAGKGSSKAAIGLDQRVKHAVKVCSEVSTPVLLLTGLGESKEIAEEIRATYLSAIKKASAHLHTYFIRAVIEEGLDGLVARLSNLVERPVAVETSGFEVLASQNMGSTPANQQRTLNEEIAEELQREIRYQDNGSDPQLAVEPIRLGRRLVAPIVLEGAVIGYMSMMMRQGDDWSLLAEYLNSAAIAALVDFGQRRREFSLVSVTHKSLLKDLLSGDTLDASDQERLQQYFGFDICDGFIVFAVQVFPTEIAKTINWTEERRAVVEMEGATVLILPFDSQKKSWREMAEELKASLAKQNTEMKLQLGAGRLAETILDLPDAYSEARQAFVTGSMIHGDEEFAIGYGDLGIKRILYLMIDHPELERFYEEHLAPLEAYDTEWESDLVPTLRVYLQQGYNLNSAAKELFIHRHTMRYRLEQIADLLKVDIDSTEVLLNLQIAFEIKDMKGKAKS